MGAPTTPLTTARMTAAANLATPRAAGPTPWTSLPSDLLEQSCKRVGVLGIVFAGLWLIAAVMSNFFAPAMQESLPMHRHAWPMPGNVLAAIGITMSIGMVFLAARLHHRPNVLLDLTLGFEVATALLIGIMNHWVPMPSMGGVSWIAVVILVFPTIVPNTPGKILMASLLAASMDPAGLLVAKLRGAAFDFPPMAMIWGFTANYILAAVAVVPAHIIRGLGRQVRRARQLGSYKLGDLIGSGGMGEVHHAEHRLLARPAAIKLIRPEVLGASTAEAAHVAVERFRREAQAAATLRSPHTIELYDFGMAQDGTFYYVMELLDGLGLEALIERFGPVPAERAAWLVRQMCLSLAEAHGQGLIHRDIKPSNVFTTRLGTQVDFVKVLDFGLVKAEQGHEQTMLTAPHVTTGTPAYMAPELAMGESDLNHRVDIYALGGVLYWLLTGQLVFEANTAMKMMHRHIADPPEPPSRRTELAIPPALEELTLACLAKQADDRPATAQAVIKQLDAIVFAEPWTEERARHWWDAHLPQAPPPEPCTKGELAPVMSDAAA